MKTELLYIPRVAREPSCTAWIGFMPSLFFSPLIFLLRQTFLIQNLHMHREIRESTGQLFYTFTFSL